MQSFVSSQIGKAALGETGRDVDSEERVKEKRSIGEC